MDAGRELDFIIADKVMKIDLNVKMNTMSQTMPYEKVKEYSTDIKAAWDVINKLKQDVYTLSLEFHSGEWFLRVNGQGASDYMGSSESAPHAICLTALKLAGVK